MKIKELCNELLEAYSNQNLTRISVTLINLYRNKQFGTLGKITEMISETVSIDIDPEARFFPKLMMLYHPDRGNYHRQEIGRLAAENNKGGLDSYTHIFALSRIEEISSLIASYEDIDYSPVYEWDIHSEGFIIINDEGKSRQEKNYSKHKRHSGTSFYCAVKLRMYGSSRIELPPHYLEDIDEFELSQSGIDDLDGVQYCTHAVIMDLSYNQIEDISLLWGLAMLEEINLSDNRIADIDTLSNLKNIRTLYLAGNLIRDISPLLFMEKLEYLDISGIKVPADQVKKLTELGVTVIT
jgi:hypothetical protein